MPASPRTARAINDRSALRLLQQRGPLTAGQLRDLTGLSRPTVADLLERLQDAGLVEPAGDAASQRRGPNARLYALVAGRAQLAALDVRTGSVAVLVADLTGRTLAEDVRPVEPGTGTAVEETAALLERTVRAARATRLHTVAVGAPGLVDPDTGALRSAAGPPAWHHRLAAALRERLPAAVLLDNEANLAAVAEQRLGAARDRDTFVLLWLGHGTGAALFLDGRLRRGASGGAGEIGFLPVPGTSRLPGAADCEGGFHSLAAGAAVCRLAAEHGLAASAEPAGTHAPPAEEVVRAAVSAGARGGPFLDALADRVALAAAAACAVLDPGCVVLGGEVGHAGGTPLATRVHSRLAAVSPLPTEVRAGALGGAGVLRGALLVARDAAQEELFTGLPAGLSTALPAGPPTGPSTALPTGPPRPAR